VTTVADRLTRPGIRQATRGDLLDVFRIERESFAQPWPFSAFEGHLGDPGFLVAEPAGDGVVGYVVADTVPTRGRPLGHVKDLAVHPDARGRGVGTSLLERALGVLRSTGATRAKLEVRRSNRRAISLYREFGFEYHRTLDRYYADGEDAFVMLVGL